MLEFIQEKNPNIYDLPFETAIKAEISLINKLQKKKKLTSVPCRPGRKRVVDIYLIAIRTLIEPNPEIKPAKGILRVREQFISEDQDHPVSFHLMEP